MPFSNLGLSGALAKAAARHYEQPYPIQQQAIPVILDGRDVLGIAKTGSGKTASFVLPILNAFQRKGPSQRRFIQTLVLVPTRELAGQVAEVFQLFSAGLPRRVTAVAVFGGVSINPQMIALRNADIVVATPGRLLDLMAANALQLSDVDTLVLDEADKMLELGFEEEMTRIFDRLPRKRQTILFSATLGDAIQDINRDLLRNPVTIEIVEEEQNLDLIKQTAYVVLPEQKGPMLRYLIKSRQMKQVLIFVSSTRTADNVVTKLAKNGIQAAAIHSGKTQGARTDALTKFKAGKLTALVATDLISRGIDIHQLPCVINFELPRSPKEYVHRIGRTGRAEATGEAISLLTSEDEHHFYIIQKKMKKRVEITGTDDLDLSGY